MRKKKTTAETIRSSPTPQTSKVVRICAELVVLRRPQSISRICYKGDVIEDPWPELLQAAYLDEQHRVLQVIEIEADKEV